MQRPGTIPVVPASQTAGSRAHASSYDIGIVNEPGGALVDVVVTATARDALGTRERLCPPLQAVSARTSSAHAPMGLTISGRLALAPRSNLPTGQGA